MQKTALYDEHLAAHGKMVSFAGWQMPLHYGSQLEEHHIVRRHAGLFDVSHMKLISIEGRDATLFLRRLLANDVKKLYPGKALYSCLLNEAGGIKDDLIVYQLSAVRYIMVVNAAMAAKDFKWLQANALNPSYDDLSIRSIENKSLIALQGPSAKIILDKAQYYTDLKPFHCYENINYFIARTGYTGEDGFEIAMSNDAVIEFWKTLIMLDAKPCGLGARDTLRLEAGLNLYGQDMNESTDPFESNLGWTIDFSDKTRDFIGRSALEQLLQKGINKKLIGLILEGAGIMRHNMMLYHDASDQSIGILTSGGFSPTLNLSIALARVQNIDFKRLQVGLKHKRQDVQIVKLPFIKAV